MCYFALHCLECAEQGSPGAWVSALVAWLPCSAISGKGERSHQPSYFPDISRIILVLLFGNFRCLGMTRIFEFCPLSGYSGARSRGSSLTRHEGSGCFPYPWRVVCESPCPETGIGLLPNLDGFLLFPPLRPLLLSSPPFGGVGGLGAPPFVFLSFSFPFFLPPWVTLKSEKGSRVRADSGQPYWLKCLRICI